MTKCIAITPQSLHNQFYSPSKPSEFYPFAARSLPQMLHFAPPPWSIVTLWTSSTLLPTRPPTHLSIHPSIPTSSCIKVRKPITCDFTFWHTEAKGFNSSDVEASYRKTLHLLMSKASEYFQRCYECSKIRSPARQTLRLIKSQESNWHRRLLWTSVRFQTQWNNTKTSNTTSLRPHLYIICSD